MNDAEPQQASRNAFEAWFATSRRCRGKARAPSFEQRTDGTYADDQTQRHWWTWQQGAKHAAAEPAAPAPVPGMRSDWMCLTEI